MRMLRFGIALVVCASAFVLAGCPADSSTEASSTVEEIQKNNPKDGTVISEQEASGDATGMAGPRKGGG